MSTPVSSGIGTGAAQVYDTHRTYDAMTKALDTAVENDSYQKKLAQQKIKEDKEKQERDYGKIAALHKLTEVSYANMKPKDVELSLGNSDEFQKKYDGKWGLIADNDPTITNEFYKDLSILKSSIDKRVASWDFIKKNINDIHSDPDAYDKATVDLAENFLNTPDADISQYKFPKKLKIGDVYQELADENAGIILGEQHSSTTDKGTNANTGVFFAPDQNKSYLNFKNSVGRSSEKIEKLLAIHSNNPEEVGIDKDGNQSPEGYEKMIKMAYVGAQQKFKIDEVRINTTNKPEAPDKDPYAGQGITVNPDGDKILTLGKSIPLKGDVTSLDGKTTQNIYGEFNNFFQDKRGITYATVTYQTDGGDGKQPVFTTKRVILQEDLANQAAIAVGAKESLGTYINKMPIRNKQKMVSIGKKDEKKVDNKKGNSGLY